MRWQERVKLAWRVLCCEHYYRSLKTYDDGNWEHRCNDCGVVTQRGPISGR